jgi:flagellar biosynthesis/type III secretory pathway M-ring protein FliF/YscJ
MAEENNLEDLENPGEIELDNMDASDDVLNDDVLLDDIEDEETEDKPSSFGIITNLLQNRRRLVIFGLILFGVVVWGGYAIYSKQESKSDQLSSPMGMQETPVFDNSNIVQKKSVKKKKKKIKYVDLYRQLESRQLGPILRELSYLNILYNVIQNGKQFDLQVDQQQLEQAKKVLAIKGMPSSVAKGYEIFDEASNLGVTEFDKRIRLVRALSGEMEKSIMEFDSVDYAYVEIVIPETKLFAVTQPPVTSSILIKRRNGASINDEMVYAMMQLVSNSVENLSPENISVVDTEGRVLSTGVLDRVTKKIKESAEKDKVLVGAQRNVGNGQVIIPAIEDVVDWFQLKFNYETVLEKKALNQLNGVLPEGSYKTAVTIDLNSVTKTGAPNIKQIVTSIVVDDQYEEVELNDQTRAQITQAAAGAVGYVEGRDQIHISKASFLPKRQLVVEDEIDPLSKKMILPKDTVLDRFKRISRLWPILGIGSLLAMGLLIIGYGLKIVFVGIGQGAVKVGGVFQRPSKHELPPDFDQGLEDELTKEKPLIAADVVNNIKTKAEYAKVIQLKALSTQESDVIVRVLKDLINKG